MSLNRYRYTHPEHLKMGDRFTLTPSASCTVTSVDRTGVAANVDLAVDGHTFPTALLLDDLRRLFPNGIRVITHDVETAINGINRQLKTIDERLSWLENPGER